jgi:hypothetical protein
MRCCCWRGFRPLGCRAVLGRGKTSGDDAKREPTTISIKAGERGWLAYGAFPCDSHPPISFGRHQMTGLLASCPWLRRPAAWFGRSLLCWRPVPMVPFWPIICPITSLISLGRRLRDDGWSAWVHLPHAAPTHRSRDLTSELVWLVWQSSESGSSREGQAVGVKTQCQCATNRRLQDAAAP